MLEIPVDDHPLLDVRWFVSTFAAPLSEVAVDARVAALLKPGASAPFSVDEHVRSAIRDLLRHGGFKPTGRSKPASEYLQKAVEAGTLGSINAAVDAANAVRLHSGIPISVVDLGRAHAPFRIGLCAPNTEYVFNTAGQVIDVAGLVSFFDAEGPCAGPVKDSHRTKTQAGTTQTLGILWGSKALGDRTERALQWYQTLVG